MNRHPLGTNAGRIRVVMIAGGLLVLSGCNIATVVGGGTLSATTATSISQSPTGSGFGSSTSLYTVDSTNSVVSTVSLSSDTESVVAGNGTDGSSGDGGPATAAQLNHPGAVTVEPNAAIIADTGNNKIRDLARTTRSHFGQSMTSGHIYTIGGTGLAGYSGDGATATAATFSSPTGISLDANGDPVIADTGNNVIRVIASTTGTYDNISMIQGDVYTIAGDGTLGYSGDAASATSATLDQPSCALVDGNGNVVIADSGNNVIRVVAESSGTFYGVAMTSGSIYTLAGDGVAGYSGDGGPAAAAEFQQPTGMALDSSGNLIIADSLNSVVRVLAESTGTYFGASMTADDVYTVMGNGTLGYSGDGGPALSAELADPTGVSLQGSENILVSDSGNDRIRERAIRNITQFGITMTAGDIYTIAGNGASRTSGSGGLSATSTVLDSPSGVASASSGSIAVSDTGGNVLRYVAGSSGTQFGVTMSDGDAYSIGGTGVAGYAGDGAIGSSAELNSPTAVVADSFGNIVFADSGNNVVRLIARSSGTYYGISATAGYIYTIGGNGVDGYSGDGGTATAATLNDPTGLALDAAGNIIVADSDNNVVRCIAEASGTYYGQATSVGDIYTIAGNNVAGYSGDGSGVLSAEFDQPTGLAVDASGNIVIADTFNNVVRLYALNSGSYFGRTVVAGNIYTIVGTGIEGYSGDGSPASMADLASPTGLTFDSAGNLIISDTSNSVIRGVPISTGSLYGTSVTADDIYTFAGNGVAGFAGDGGSWTTSSLNFPEGIAIDGSGNLLIADTLNNRIRKLS